MSTTTQPTKNDVEEHRDDVPGAYFGTDGRGRLHYYQSGSRRVTVLHPDTGSRKTFCVDNDQDLIDWGIATVKEISAYWEEVRVEEPKNKWLTGELPVGEFEEADA